MYFQRHVIPLRQAERDKLPKSELEGKTENVESC